MTGPLRIPARLTRQIEDRAGQPTNWRTFPAGTRVVVIGIHERDLWWCEIEGRLVTVHDRHLTPHVPADASNREGPP